MAQMSEKETSFELIEALIHYIKSLNVDGAILVFLPGWNLIFAMQKFLENQLSNFSTSLLLGWEIMVVVWGLGKRRENT